MHVMVLSSKPVLITADTITAERFAELVAEVATDTGGAVLAVDDNRFEARVRFSNVTRTLKLWSDVPTDDIRVG